MKDWLNFGKLLGIFLLALGAGVGLFCYGTYVTMCLWKWFIVPASTGVLQPLSFWLAMGLTMTLSYMTGTTTLSLKVKSDTKSEVPMLSIGVTLVALHGLGYLISLGV